MLTFIPNNRLKIYFCIAIQIKALYDFRIKFSFLSNFRIAGFHTNSLSSEKKNKV